MKRMTLEGSWSLRRLADNSLRPIAIPGDILSALVASGEAPDPYYGKNELDLQWIGREDWVIEREIDLPASFLGAPNIFMEAESIDTVAEVSINGHMLGRSRNMFRRFRADTRSALVDGTNLISILIRSPEKAAIDAAASLPYPVPCSTYPISSPHRNLLRKAQCMAGWDWGPCLMTGGVYDGIALIATDGARIEYATTTRHVREGDAKRRNWSVQVKVEIDAPAAMEAELELELAGARTKRRLSLSAGASVFTEELEVDGVEPWWPAGCGGQPLYELAVACRSASKGAGGEIGGHELRKRIGFRELGLAVEKDGRQEHDLPRQRERYILQGGQLDTGRRPPFALVEGKSRGSPPFGGRCEHELHPRLGRRSLRIGVFLRALRRTRPPRLAGSDVLLRALSLIARVSIRSRLGSPPPDTAPQGPSVAGALVRQQ